ncbi:protein arginine N-methyltransferase 1.6 isoform X5 [Solanum lycopersicum]|uniref:protein arginine N-methyltransferase 1.6 isoform X5 n=1 Tax=Solanum lycopersicum TaxID=4081 RepID=UPI000532F958|nr:protein arginine N-methyltransferase 1.6 isoform X4 [Solanum lycopersicum]
MQCLFPKTLNPQFFLRSFNNTRSKAFTVRSMSSGSRMFQLKVDPLTGNSEWVVIEEDEASGDATKQLLANTSYLDMLNDTRRNKAYREAIDKTITKPCHVLDIGAGTGLLSMMAARAMDLGDSVESSGSKGMVTACESYLPMVKLMRKVLHANGMQRKIRIINKRSDELEVGVDMPSRADVLVSEILDSELLGEGLIPTLQHAHDQLLVDNPKTVPYRATVYGQVFDHGFIFKYSFADSHWVPFGYKAVIFPQLTFQLVESTDLWKLHDLYNTEKEVLDEICLVPEGMDSALCVKRQQFSMHCDALEEDIKLLSEPFKVFDFDFWRRPDSHRVTKLSVQATDTGAVHAVISWWLLQLDEKGTIFYSTAPKWISCPSSVEGFNSSISWSQNWCDHWKQCVWFIPKKGLSLLKDEEVSLLAVHTDTSISYEMKTLSQNLELEQSEMKQKTPSLCVVVDDSIFLAVALAHLAKGSHVLSLFPGLQEKGALYLQAVATANGYSKDHVEVQKMSELLTSQSSQEKQIDLLVGEPFYYGNNSVLPWQNLRFWKDRSLLDSILSEGAVIMPCKGLLKACAMSLPDLWQSHQCLQHVEGFDHSVVNSTLGACGGLPPGQENPTLPFSVWQCGESKKMSDIVTIMEFNFLKTISPCSGKAKVEFISHGKCHGFVLWIDWVMDAEESIVLSTGPEQRYWKQGVKLMKEPVAVGSHRSATTDCHSADIETSFDPSTGDLIVEYAFL